MKLHNLQPAEGSTHSRRRIGRGPGSGLGGTSTRGHKGAKARSGYKKKIGFEGGQMPLQRRVPKSGFKNINRVEYKAINLGVLQTLAESKNLSVITVQSLIDAGFISSKQLVKILGNGSLTTKVDVEAHAFSKSAEEAIKALGGTVTKLQDEENYRNTKEYLENRRSSGSSSHYDSFCSDIPLWIIRGYTRY